jgi:hypothetical protein
MGRYSNYRDQGERIRGLLEMVPNGTNEVSEHTQVQLRLRPREILELAACYRVGDTTAELAKRFKIRRK